MGQTDKDDLIRLIEEDDLDIEMPTTLPLLPVRDVVIFSDMLLPLFIGREKSLRAVEEAVASEGYLLLATQKDPAIENPDTADIYTTGTIGRVLRMLKLPDGRAKVLVQGLTIGKILRFVRKRSSFRVKVELISEIPVQEVNLETEALMRNVKEHSEQIMILRGEVSGDIGPILESIEDPG